MLNNGRILAVVDYLQADQPGLDQAVSLAKKTDSQVMALVVVYDRAAEVDAMFTGTVLHNMRKPYVATAEQWLAEYLSDYQNHGVTIETKVIWHKREYKATLDFLKEVECDLIVKSSKHHPLLKRVVHTPDDWHLIRGAKVSLLFVKECYANDGERVLLAVDTANQDAGHQVLNQKIVAYGKQFAELYAGDVHLLNAYPVLKGVTVIIPETANYELYERDVREGHLSALNQFAEDHGISVEAAHLRQGAVGLAAQDLVEELDVNLVVCGTYGRTGIEGLVIGNSAESILEHTDCNLLVLKPTE